MAAKSSSAKMTLKISSFILRLLLNIVFYVLAVILIIYCSKAAFKFAYQIYGPVTVDSKPGRDIIVQIKKGDTTMDVASKLELNRAVVNKYSFYFKTKLQGYVVMPGTYSINSSMTYGEILDIITDYSASLIQDETEKKKDTGSSGAAGSTGTGSGNEALKESDTKTDTETDTKTDANADTKTDADANNGTNAETDTNKNTD
jgi:UPF0755 protein